MEHASWSWIDEGATCSRAIRSSAFCASLLVTWLSCCCLSVSTSQQLVPSMSSWLASLRLVWSSDAARSGWDWVLGCLFWREGRVYRLKKAWSTHWSMERSKDNRASGTYLCHEVYDVCKTSYAYTRSTESWNSYSQLFNEGIVVACIIKTYR